MFGRGARLHCTPNRLAVCASAWCAVPCALMTPRFAWLHGVQVADFGLSRGGAAGAVVDGEEVYYRAQKSAFPVRWTAPEAMESMVFNSATDVWSYGVLLLEIYLDGGRPYADMSNGAVIARVAAGYRAPKPGNCTASIYADVMLTCWDADALERPSFTQIAGVLENSVAALGGAGRNTAAASGCTTTGEESYEMPSAENMQRLSQSGGGGGAPSPGNAQKAKRQTPQPVYE